MSQRFILGQKWKCPQSCSFDMQNIEEGICSPPLGFQIVRSEIDFAILFLICWMHFMAMAAFSPSHPDLELALWLKVSLPSIDQFCFQGNENTPEPFWESVCKEDLGLFSLFPPLSSLLASLGVTLVKSIWEDLIEYWRTARKTPIFLVSRKLKPEKRVKKLSLLIVRKNVIGIVIVMWNTFANRI